MERLQQDILANLKDSSKLQKDEKIVLWNEELSEASRKKSCSGNNLHHNFYLFLQLGLYRFIYENEWFFQDYRQIM